jgi:hypothetical protein
LEKDARKRGGLIAMLLPFFVFKPRSAIESELLFLFHARESHASNAAESSFSSQVIRFLRKAT